MNPVKVSLIIVGVGAIGLIGYYVFMNRDNEKRMASGNSNNEVQGTIVDNRPASDSNNRNNNRSIERNSGNSDEFDRWRRSLIPTFADFVNSLSNETIEWLKGMEPEDRMSFLRRSAPRAESNSVANSDGRPSTPLQFT